jgi:hypothetical protein
MAIIGRNNFGGQQGFIVYIGDLSTPVGENFSLEERLPRNLDEYRTTYDGSTFIFKTDHWEKINTTAI